MRLADILMENDIISDLKARDKKGVLEELAEVVSRHNPSVDRVVLVNVLVERENLGSTGIGDGVAIPHGKLKGVDQPIVSFGRSKTGLDFDSMDAQPVHLFFLLIAPENSSGMHLQVLAKIAKILKNSAFRKLLMEASGRGDLYRTITDMDEES
ncbi:MAG: PTS sugar transporter subunit IIA [Deltaproteobacteria bacterium]|nr:PTS sugar transporter subunit IIA [Deltaproteobacteria bacterium]